MATKNDEMAAQVGMDKPVKQVTELYDREHGEYEQQAPALESTPQPKGPTSFQLGK